MDKEELQALLKQAPQKVILNSVVAVDSKMSEMFLTGAEVIEALRKFEGCYCRVIIEQIPYTTQKANYDSDKSTD